MSHVLRNPLVSGRLRQLVIPTPRDLKFPSDVLGGGPLPSLAGALSSLRGWKLPLSAGLQQRVLSLTTPFLPFLVGLSLSCRTSWTWAPFFILCLLLKSICSAFWSFSVLSSRALLFAFAIMFFNFHELFSLCMFLFKWVTFGSFFSDLASSLTSLYILVTTFIRCFLPPALPFFPPVAPPPLSPTRLGCRLPWWKLPQMSGNPGLPDGH